MFSSSEEGDSKEVKRPLSSVNSLSRLERDMLNTLNKSIKHNQYHIIRITFESNIIQKLSGELLSSAIDSVKNNADILELLLKDGADPEAVCQDQKNIFDLIRKKSDLAQFLILDCLERNVEKNASFLEKLKQFDQSDQKYRLFAFLRKEFSEKDFTFWFDYKNLIPSARFSLKIHLDNAMKNLETLPFHFSDSHSFDIHQSNYFDGPLIKIYFLAQFLDEQEHVARIKAYVLKNFENTLHNANQEKLSDFKSSRSEKYVYQMLFLLIKYDLLDENNKEKVMQYVYSKLEAGWSDERFLGLSYRHIIQILQKAGLLSVGLYNMCRRHLDAHETYIQSEPHKKILKQLAIKYLEAEIESSLSPSLREKLKNKIQFSYDEINGRFTFMYKIPERNGITAEITGDIPSEIFYPFKSQQVPRPSIAVRDIPAYFEKKREKFIDFDQQVKKEFFALKNYDDVFANCFLQDEIWNAVSQSKSERVKQLLPLKKWINFNEHRKFGRSFHGSLLHLAIVNKMDIETTKDLHKLYNGGACVYYYDKDRSLPLYGCGEKCSTLELAVIVGNVEFVKYYIDYKLDMNSIEDYLETSKMQKYDELVEYFSLLKKQCEETAAINQQEPNSIRLKM